MTEQLKFDLSEPGDRRELAALIAQFQAEGVIFSLVRTEGGFVSFRF